MDLPSPTDSEDFGEMLCWFYKELQQRMAGAPEDPQRNSSVLAGTGFETVL